MDTISGRAWPLLMLVAFLTGMASGSDAKKSIVFVGAHPDDTEGFAATAFLLRERYDLHIVDLTRGENGLGLAGRLDGSTERTRMDEERQACALLGATPHFLHDVNGAAEMTRASVDALVHIFTNLQPVAVFAHWPIDTHPDHVQATAAVLHVLNITNMKPEFYLYEVVPDETMQFRPLYSVDVSRTMELKTRMMRLYVCQNEGDTLAQMKILQARGRGAKHRPPVKYAEVFTSFDGRRIKGGVLEGLSETLVLESASVQ